MKKTLFLLFVSFLFASCNRTTSLNQMLELAGENRVELEKVLEHYRLLGDERKVKAAEFLISNMFNKFHYRGEVLDEYDRIFNILDSLHQQGAYKGKSLVIKEPWDDLVNTYGPINISKLNKVYDYKSLSADFFIQNIDEAFDAWTESPLYNPNNFELFCEYILPHRTEYETVEVYRHRYYEYFKHILDTVTSPQGIIDGFSYELSNNLQYNKGSNLKGYPIDIPISKMEKGRSGTCRHMAIFQSLVMRACGLPVTIDESIWGNRSQGHSWNVIMNDTGKFVAFDPLMQKMRFAYKPAKIFRTKYSLNLDVINEVDMKDIPSLMEFIQKEDVTHEYVTTYDIEIPIVINDVEEGRKKNGIICVFDNTNWRVVYWGTVKGNKMHFKNMAADILYLGAYYHEGRIIPATLPFILRTDGSVTFYEPQKDNIPVMLLDRKYPEMKSVREWMASLHDAKIEGANDPNFINKTELISIIDRSKGVADSLINNSQKFRYIRMTVAENSSGNLAEIEFYGKRNKHEQESKLKGKLTGFPYIEKTDQNSYINAMDGNLETWYGKEKGSIGWVGLDLGSENEHIITKVRFCPRSDTNFILEGDTYELKYWGRNKWNTVAVKRAEQYDYISFEEVPAGTIYLLHNKTRGKEERIFTYEEGKQIWW